MMANLLAYIDPGPACVACFAKMIDRDESDLYKFSVFKNRFHI